MDIRKEAIMSDDIKVCPQCDAEYFAHAEMCSSCEVPLVLPGGGTEHDHSHEGSEIEWPEGPSEVLMEASFEILKDMGNALNKHKLPYEIYEKPHVEGHESNKKAKSCQAGQSEYAIVVPKANMEESIKITEERWYELHPDQREGDQRTSLGQCPACATDLKGATTECPDCGLNLAGVPSSGGDCC